MKQMTQNLRWLVTLLVMIVSFGAWAQSSTTTTTSFKLKDNVNSMIQDGIHVLFKIGDGSTAPTWYTAGKRFYASNTITIFSDENINITGITFNWEKQGNKQFASVTASDGTYNHPTTTGEGVWSGSSKNIIFTLGSTGQLQLNTFSVTFESSSDSPVETVATPTFFPTGGTFTGTQSVEISCETTGADIYYTTDDSSPSDSNGTLYENPITISASTTIKAIAIKDGESSEIVSATYEIVQPSAGLEYSAISAEVSFNDTPYSLPILRNPNAVTVAYSSSNVNVATVNPTTGEVTICGVGTTTITATFAGNDDYMAGSASYTLKVNPMNSAEIDLVNNESVTFTKDSWTNVSSGSYPSGETEKPFIGSDGTSTTWNYKNVLRLTNELQFKASEGMLSSPKVDCLDGYGYKVTISFTSKSKNPSGNLEVTASTGEFESMVAPKTNVDATLSLDVCGWSNVTISNKCSKALYVNEIKFERISIETVEIMVSDKAKIDNDFYATFSNSEKALHFGAVKGLNAYIVETAEKESSAITLLEVAKVPANTGLLVCGTTPKTYKVPVIPSTSADEIFNNMLHPSTGMTGDGKSVFILANGNKGLGFYIVKNGSSLKSNQAYLKIDNGTSPEIKTFFSLGGDYVNDINQIKTETLPKNNCFYDMNGQRVAAPLKGGLYIKNGKKFLFQSKNK